MNQTAYEKWWKLHLQVARGENLNKDERAAYESGLQELDSEEKQQWKDGSLAELRKLKAVERVAPISGVPIDTPEGMGFGMWIDEVDQIDSVEYVNRVRDAESRTLSEYVAELCKA